MPSAERESPVSVPQIVAVAVLYKRGIAESESVTSLLRIAREHPEWASSLALILYDNSPEPQSVPTDLPLEVTYLHDPANGGLAPAYNYALKHAAALGSKWLLLLDQDTTLTAEYMAELFARRAELESQPKVGAIVPKLIARGTIYSPEADFLYQIRHQFQSMRHPVEPNAIGVQATPTSAYNSGAMIRVSALQAVGGFPSDFWLDYLDHATFQQLHRSGFQIFVMESRLEQILSHMDVNEVPLWRHRNVLTAQTRFVLRYGTRGDRLLYRIYLLRICRFLWRKCENRRVWREMLAQMLLLRLPSVRFGN